MATWKGCSFQRGATEAKKQGESYSVSRKFPLNFYHMVTVLLHLAVMSPAALRYGLL